MKSNRLVKILSSISYDIKRPFFSNDKLLNSIDLFDELPSSLEFRVVFSKMGKETNKML